MGVLSHFWPVEVPAKRFISFVNAQMPKDFNIMMFLEKLCPQFLVLWDYQMVPFLEIDPVFL